MKKLIKKTYQKQKFLLGTYLGMLMVFLINAVVYFDKERILVFVFFLIVVLIYSGMLLLIEKANEFSLLTIVNLLEKINKFQEDYPLSLMIGFPFLFLVVILLMNDHISLSVISFVILLLWVSPRWRNWLFKEEKKNAKREGDKK